MNKREKIIITAIKLAVKNGYGSLTQLETAKVAKVTRSLIPYYFGCLEEFKSHVMIEAVRREILPVIAEGLILKNKHALGAPTHIKKKALDSISTRT